MQIKENAPFQKKIKGSLGPPGPSPGSATGILEEKDQNTICGRRGGLMVSALDSESKILSNLV